MKKINIIPRRAKRNLKKEIKKNGFADIRGKLEITAYKNGKPFHYEVGDNVVTIWAKHATMHLLTGETFTTHGEQRSFDPDFHIEGSDAGEGVNKDGTLISGQQYFSDNSDPDFTLDTRWSKSTINPDTNSGDAGGNSEDVKYPFFPTKMLFGTGFEWNSWSDIPEDYQSSYADDEWTESIFNENIDNNGNDYSNIFQSGSLIQARSMNDIFSGSLSTPTITDEDFAVTGAIKDGLYEDSDSERDSKIFEDGGNEFLEKEWAGVGRPSFIYARRESRFFQEQSEVALSSDSDLENKITFTVVMPEQTGTNAGIFYPYNGYTLKEAGLFCDARLLLENTVPSSGDEADLYNKLNYGIMYAKRYISPIQKSHDVSISSRWTLYL